MNAIQSRTDIAQKSESRKELMLGKMQRIKGLEILMSEAKHTNENENKRI